MSSHVCGNKVGKFDAVFVSLAETDLELFLDMQIRVSLAGRCELQEANKAICAGCVASQHSTFATFKANVIRFVSQNMSMH